MDARLLYSALDHLWKILTSIDNTPDPVVEVEASEFAIPLAKGIPAFVDFATKEAEPATSSEIDTQYGQKNRLFGMPQCTVIQLLMSSLELG